MSDEVRGALIAMGNLHMVDDPEAEGSSSLPYGVPMALVIQFHSKEDIRRAIKEGRCTFYWNSGAGDE
jgi:hypothetical protein